MEGHWEGGGAQSVRDILAEASLRHSGGISVGQPCLMFPVNPLTNVRMNLEALGGTRQMRTFRGAQCICDLGVTDASLCDWPSCGICSIIKSCFTTFEFGATSNPGRFGNGIYTYFDPSRADRFATSSLSTPYRAILLCEVNLPTKSSNASKSPLVAKSVSTSVCENDSQQLTS